MSGHTHPSCIPHPIPHLTIGTLGHRGHGKTTLAAALAAARDPAAAHGAPVRPDPRRRRSRRATGTRSFRYATDTRRYTLLDPGHTECPGSPGCPESLESAGSSLGAEALRGLDGAVIVVSVLEGVRPCTAGQLALARRSGLAHLVVALTMADAGSDELTELVETEVRELLTRHGYAGETLPAVRVSARSALQGDPRWQGTIEALLDAVDTYVPLPEVL
ncbi:GTP-binding protein [Streptomyces sp. 891-h]|uniref:GTP-binding protein n=1 Tax=Streptomyces sp. 891-h TaxID=2720714 RepID=UPI001FA9E3BA|nr:GTP-binding protein [Streptomyces sp. 891-h]UNZ20654.1 hypothetical protein HC362_29885 [Streptomyces sp. 891-h]